MADSRLDQLAKTLVHYSVVARPGEHIVIRCTELAEPLALAVYRQVLAAGANASFLATFDSAASVLYRHGTDEQLSWVNTVQVEAARQADAIISIRAPVNTKMLSGVEPAKQVLQQKAYRPFLDVVLQKRWVVCEFPTPALAQEAGMSLADFEDFSFGAVLIDWPAMRDDLQRRKEQFEAATEVRLVGKGTDLRLGVGGRTWIPDDGKHNMPGGEIFTGPIEDSVEGEVLYDFPAVYQGREVEGVRLRFQAGKIVDASAIKGEEFLVSMLDADEGARRLGEIGIGTNYGIRQFSKSVLFDEKIGGTVHLAVGRSYEETGGTNQSAVHWDMVKDLRDGGEIQLDGQSVQRNGQFLDA